MKKEEFFKRVSLVDEEAGHRLRYISAKATSCSIYAKLIHFHGEADKFPQTKAYDVLTYFFSWRRTYEGLMYWAIVHDKLVENEL